jgi:hypothetical protein
LRKKLLSGLPAIQQRAAQMRILIVFLFTLLTVSTTFSAEKQEGAEYQNWCTRLADAEELSGNVRNDYIHKCMKSLAAADGTPDKDRNSADDGE